MYDPKAAGLTLFKQSGNGEVKSICPFHHGKTNGAFSFNVFTGVYHCFSCGAKGNINSLVRETGGSIVEVEAASITPLQDNSWREILNAPIAINEPYLLGKRHLKEETIQTMAIRKTSNGIAFPLWNLEHTEIIGFQERLSDPAAKFRYIVRGERPAFVSIKPVKELPNKIMVVEGIFGMLNAYECGVPAVALMGAASYTIHTIDLLQNFESVLQFDDDDAGYANASNIVKATSGEIGAIIPGCEADEINYDSWQRRYNMKPERSYNKIRERILNPDYKRVMCN